MRRARDLKEHRDALRRKVVDDRQRRRKIKTKAKIQAAKKKNAEISQKRQMKELARRGGVVSKIFELNFQKFDEYTCSVKEKIKVCHIIESLGMGGGQTMMMELIRSLDKFYPDHIHNIVVCPRPAHQKYEKSLYASYGISPQVIRDRELGRLLVRENINIVLQHRLAVSKCLKGLIPSNVKYIVMNHTYHQLGKLASFIKCDAYISVCDYLHNEARWSRVIHPSRIFPILNGVENDYLSDIVPAELAGNFKTGRCHRLVSNKFRIDSLKWMNDKVKRVIPEHQHYLIGHNAEAKKICKKSDVCNYLGSITKRNEKMSILKALDLYFYETYGQEGASIAVLESLACGVPVLCRDFGGNRELIKDGVNGFVLNTRDEFLNKMKEFQDKDKLAALSHSTIEDFNDRLHVKHSATKYMQLFEKILS